MCPDSRGRGPGGRGRGGGGWKWPDMPGVHYGLPLNREISGHLAMDIL